MCSPGGFLELQMAIRVDFSDTNVLRGTIGVNRSAIVREIPHFGLIPAFTHFFQNVPHFCFFFEVKKSLKIAIVLAVRSYFVRKSSAKTSVIASPSY